MVLDVFFKRRTLSFQVIFISMTNCDQFIIALQLEISKYLFNSIFHFKSAFQIWTGTTSTDIQQMKKNLSACGNSRTGTHPHWTEFKKVFLATDFWLHNNATITSCGRWEDQAPLPFPSPRISYHNYFNFITFILCFKCIY